jgi:lysophospholipase L1-like esterase
MKSLPLEQIALLTQGALGLRFDRDAVQPLRLPPLDLPLHHPALRSPMTAESAAGVRLRLETDSDRLWLEVEHDPIPMATPMMSLPACAYDLVTPDGRVRRVTAERPEGPAEIRFEGLGRDLKVVEVWLPQGAGVRIRGLAVDAGARLDPAPDDRPLWVTYGSSITHCAWVPGPTDTWPSIAARRLDWRLTCLGFNGACHLDPLVARAMAALEADRYTLKLGINVHNLQTLRARTFAPLVHGFIATLRDRRPDTPITLISPIFSPEREDSPVSTIPTYFGGDPLTGDLSLNAMRETLQEVVELHRACGDAAIDYLDGRDMFGEADAALLPDGLHPSPEGYALMGERFVRIFAARSPQSAGARSSCSA